MDDLLSEKEQIEEMRAWWSENGRYVIAGVVLAAGLLVGISQYRSSKLEAQIVASALYESLAEHVADGDLDDAEAVADDLATNYANTTYVAQSKLAMARLYMDKNRDQDAADVLNEMLVLSRDDELKNIGRVRLARILLYQDRAQAVVDLLSNQNIPAFASIYDEILGDAYTLLGRVEDAGDAYRSALAGTSQTATVSRGLIQMKLVDLPEVLATPAEPAQSDDVAEPISASAPEALVEEVEEAGEAE